MSKGKTAQTPVSLAPSFITDTGTKRLLAILSKGVPKYRALSCRRVAYSRMREPKTLPKRPWRILRIFSKP